MRKSIDELSDLVQQRFKLDPFIKASMPDPVVKGSFATPKSITHIMTQKFVMGVPLYRQEQD